MPKLRFRSLFMIPAAFMMLAAVAFAAGETTPLVLRRSWSIQPYCHTPARDFADYVALNGLPQVDLQMTAQSSNGTTTVTLTNPARAIAFAVHLKLRKNSAGDDEVLPVLWEDNYIALLPGETRQVSATYNLRDIGKGLAAVEADGWNVKIRVVRQ